MIEFATKCSIPFGLLFLSACNASSNLDTTQSFGAKSVSIIQVCSGYGCIIKDKFRFTKAETKELRTMFATVSNAEEERATVSGAIGRMEEMARGHLRYRPDKRLAEFRRAGTRGEMDCVDESLNTIGYLFYLRDQKILHFHKPTKNYAERGLFIDGRYPHKSAVMQDKETMKWWAVDSWKENDGQPAQIITLAEWRKELPSAYRY